MFDYRIGIQYFILLLLQYCNSFLQNYFRISCDIRNMEILQSSFYDQRKGTRAFYPLIGSSEKDHHPTEFLFLPNRRKLLENV
jgi:hypothetical protein